MNEWEWDLLESGEPVEQVEILGVEIRKGDRVRIWPRGRADILDMVLAGRIAVIESIEQDYEGNIHLAVVAEDDPGKDMGMIRQPGHRFFYSLDEVEPLLPGEAEGEGL